MCLCAFNAFPTFLSALSRLFVCSDYFSSIYPDQMIFYLTILPSSSSFSYSHFSVGSMYDDICLHLARSYTSSSDFVQPSSLRSSFVPCHFHRPPSYVVLLSSHHMPIPLQPPFLDILCNFPHFRCPLILSFLILSSVVTPHIHRRIPISASSNFISCAFLNAHVSAPFTSAGLTTVLYTFP